MHPHDLATEPMFQFELIWFALKALNKMNCFLFASTSYLSFLWFSLKACYFLLLTNASHLIQLLPNRPKSECKLWKFTMIQVCPFCWVKVPKLQKKYGSINRSQLHVAWPFELHMKQKQSAASLVISCLFCSQMNCLAISDPICVIQHDFSV